MAGWGTPLTHSEQWACCPGLLPGLSQEGHQSHSLGMTPIAMSQWERLSCLPDRLRGLVA